YRGPVNVELAPRRVAELAPEIERSVAFLIDRFIERGECDFVEELTSPASALVTLELLDFPTDDWERYAAGFHNMIGNDVGRPGWQHGAELVQWIDGQCRETVAARVAQPTDDLTSRFLARDVDGCPMTPERVEMLLFHFIGGGTETTGSLTASALK